MPFNIDTRVSLMDVIAIGGALFAGYKVMFDVGSGVEMNAQQIAQNHKDIGGMKAEMRREVDRLESNVGGIEEQIAEQFQLINQEVKETRLESAAGRQRIEDKLDRLIERELSQQ